MKIRKRVVRGQVVLCESVSRSWSNEKQREKEGERKAELREVDKANWNSGTKFLSVMIVHPWLCLLYVVYVQRIDRIPIWYNRWSIVWSWYCNNKKKIKKKERKEKTVLSIWNNRWWIYIYIAFRLTGGKYFRNGQSMGLVIDRMNLQMNGWYRFSAGHFG